MPRDASGNYTLPLVNPVEGGTTIDVNWANPTMADIATQLNNVFTRDGLLGPLDKFKLVDGTVAAPGLTFNSELGLGLFRDSQGVLGIASEGAVSAKFSSDGMDVPGTIGRNGVPIAEVPPGTMLDFAGNTPPFGYLVCNGQAVSRTTYAALFAAIGTLWGVGDGSTTFNIPDMRRRTTIGAGGTQIFGPGIAVGGSGGVEGATLSVANLPSHTHTITDQIHAHLLTVAGTTSAVSNDHQHYVSLGGGDHVHGIDSWRTARMSINDIPGYWAGAGGEGGAGPAANITSSTHTHAGWTGGISANHTHNLNGTWASDSRYTGINGTNATGSGAIFDNMQPSVTVNKIIKT